MKKLIALVLTVVMVCAFAGCGSASAEKVLAPGEYQDSVSQRATAIVYYEDGDDTYYITIDWSTSASEYTEWSMGATYKDGKLVYDNCQEKLFETKENGDATVTLVSSDGEGSFDVEDGKFMWTGAADENCRECVFEPVLNE